MRAPWALLLVGCGRIAYDAKPDAAADAAADAAVVTAGLIAYYPMDEILFLSAAIRGIPDEVADHDGQCMFGPGTNECPTVQAGRSGGAYQFDGIEDILRVPSAPELEATITFTVAAWIYLDSQPAARVCVATKGLGTGLANSWAACVEPGRELFFYTSITPIVSESLTSIATVPLVEWHHIAIRWDGTEKTISLDGMAIAASPGAQPSFDSETVRIGGDTLNNVPDNFFPGRIDELRIYDRALGDDELMALAQ